MADYNTYRFCANGSSCVRPVNAGETHRPSTVQRAGTVCSRCAKANRGFKQPSGEPEIQPFRTETRGRKALPVAAAEKINRLGIQRSIASQKYAKKKHLKEMFGDDTQEFKEAWAEAQTHFEEIKERRWGKKILIGPRHRRKPGSGRIIKRGVTPNGRYEWQFRESSNTGAVDLAIFKIDPATENRAFDAYLKRSVPVQVAQRMVNELNQDGFKAELYLPPISTFIKKAEDFLNSAFAGGLRRIDVEDIKKNLTFGFAAAIFKQAEKISMSPSEKRLDQIEKIYRVLGNFQIRESELTIPLVESWIWSIITAPAESTGRATKKGGPIAHTYAKKLLTTLAGIFEKLAYYPIVFPWAERVMKTIRDKRDRLQKKALSEGRLKYAGGFRCLRLSEMIAMLEYAPTVDHVAFAIIGLSAGLRPKDHCLLQPSDWDRESGTLYFGEGRLNSKNKNQSGRQVTNPHTSTVVRLILANPEFFRIEKKPEVLAWFDAAGATNMKGMDQLRAICRLNGTPIATWRDLRITAATQLAFCGMSLLDIKRRLGHVSSVTTEQYYVKAIPPDGGACSSIPQSPARGVAFLHNPILRVDGLPPHSDTNPWDAFLLVRFVEEVKKRFVNELMVKGHSRREIKDQLFPEWIRDYLTPRIKKAIDHAELMRLEWEKAIGSQDVGLADLPANDEESDDGNSIEADGNEFSDDHD